MGNIAGNFLAHKPKGITLKNQEIFDNLYDFPLQEIQYNEQGLPTNISNVLNGSVKIETQIEYDIMGNRRQLLQYHDGQLVKQKKYLGSGGIEIIENEDTTQYQPIVFANNLVALIKEHKKQQEILYIVTDYLGSIRLVLNQNGDIIKEYSYDTWGRPRDPKTHEPISFEAAGYIADLGYTGQEYLEGTQLYHYNA